MHIKLILACMSLLFTAPNLNAQHRYRSIVIDTAYGIRYYGRGTDCIMWKQYRKDSVRLRKQFKHTDPMPTDSTRHYRYSYTSINYQLPRLYACFIKSEEVA